MDDSRSDLDDQLQRQHGAVRVSQLDAAGVGDWKRRTAREAGYLEKFGAHMYRSAMAVHTVRDDLAALVLDCGTEAWASGPTAAALHGFDGFNLRPPFYIKIKRGRSIERVGHFIRTTNHLPLIDRSTVDGIRVLAPARTVLDLAKTCTVAELTVAIDSAIRDGGMSDEHFHRRLIDYRGRGRHGISKVLAAVDGQDARRGGHSWLERRYLELLHGAGLPLPTTQAVVSQRGDRLIRVDCLFAETNLVIELLGYRWHRTEAQMATDAKRLNRMQLDGLTVVQFTYGEVTTEADAVVRLTAEALSVPEIA